MNRALHRTIDTLGVGSDRLSAMTQSNAAQSLSAGTSIGAMTKQMEES